MTSEHLSLCLCFWTGHQKISRNEPRTSAGESSVMTWESVFEQQQELCQAHILLKAATETLFQSNQSCDQRPDATACTAGATRGPAASHGGSKVEPVTTAPLDKHQNGSPSHFKWLVMAPVGGAVCPCCVVVLRFTCCDGLQHFFITISGSSFPALKTFFWQTCSVITSLVHSIL